MKTTTFSRFFIILPVTLFMILHQANGQNLHNSSNAVSIENESNTTTGWTGTATFTSDTENPYDGLYSIRSVTSLSNGREIRYTFPAVIGETYNISIWARRGDYSLQPAFANWTGFAGFATRQITSTIWTEYTFTLVATSATPIIRVYTSPSSGLIQGSTIFIDRVSIFAASDTEAPSAPGNLTASDTTATSVFLSWNASSDNNGVTAYDIYSNNSLLATLPSISTTFLVSNLIPATSYEFFVRARDGAGNTSDQSNIALITTQADITPPAIPQNLIATNITQTSLTLSWDASTDNVGVSSYEVFIDSVSAGIVNSPALSIALAGLTPGTTYQLAVTATDEAGNTSAFSNPLEVTTEAPDTTPPSVPENLIATEITQTSLTLSWDTSTDNVGVSSYEVFVDSVSASIVNSPVLSIPLSGLTPGTTYQLAVTATDAAGNTSAFSNPLEVTTEAPDTTPPLVPVNLIATDITQTSLTLSWDASTDNVGVSSYEVFVDSVSAGIVNSPVLSIPLSGLTPGTTYQLAVTATDAAGNTSAFSIPLEVATEAPDTTPPSVPENLIATNISKNTLSLNWSVSTDNIEVAGYEIFQDHTSIGQTSSTVLTFPVSGLSTATTYAFTIIAFDAAGNTSAFSDTLLVTTLDVIVYTDLNANNSNTDWTARDLHIAGTVGIQTQPDSVYLLSVNGAIRAKEIVVETGWADFVFEEGYPLPALSEVEEHIRIHGHLKDIPSAAEIARDGANLGDISVKLLQKIEELTLYSIELEKRLQKLEAENSSLKKNKRKKKTNH